MVSESLPSTNTDKARWKLAQSSTNSRLTVFIFNVCVCVRERERFGSKSGRLQGGICILAFKNERTYRVKDKFFHHSKFLKVKVSPAPSKNPNKSNPHVQLGLKKR